MQLLQASRTMDNSTPSDDSSPEGSSSTSTRELSRPRNQRSPSPWMITAANEEFSNTPSNRINTSTLNSSVLIRFRSPAAHRLQMHCTSCAIWFPEDLCSGFAESFSFMTSHAPSTPSLAIALDASCLIQIGQERRDERMVLEGRKMYCDALRFLRVALARQGKGGKNDALLGTIMVLQVTEANMVMNGADWRNHSQGVTAFMRERSRNDNRSHFGWPRLVEHQFITFQFWDALIARRNLDGVLLDEAPALLLIAQSVPGALAAGDEVRSATKPFSSDRTMAVAKQLRDLEAELADWTAQWNRCMREAPFQLVSAASIPYLRQQQQQDTSSPGSHSKESDWTAFPLLFRFNNLTDCQDHIICSASMLALKRTMLSLSLHVRTHTSTTISVLPTPEALSTSITACADTLCMGLPYMCSPQHGKFGKVMTAPPLRMARDWYATQTGRKKDAAAKLAWCQEAAGMVEGEGIRMLT